MNELRINTGGQRLQTVKLVSDRDSLNFPEGGVFGPADQVVKEDEIVREVEDALHSMQQQLDELHDSLDRVLAHSHRPRLHDYENGFDRPTAA